MSEDHNGGGLRTGNITANALGWTSAYRAWHCSVRSLTPALSTGQTRMRVEKREFA